MAQKKVISEEQWLLILSESEEKPVVVFKHSPRCPLSSLALSRFESTIYPRDYYLVDVISHRNISQLMAANLQIIHESPQLLMISNRKCLFHASHLNISGSSLELALKELDNN